MALFLLVGFNNDVEPTEVGCGVTIGFLTRTGQRRTDVRQGFILLSDVLGV